MFSVGLSASGLIIEEFMVEKELETEFQIEVDESSRKPHASSAALVRIR